MADVFVGVPLGWQRELEGEKVYYVSPDLRRLGSREEVLAHLTAPGTCKCGLRCPFKLEDKFNFDPAVLGLPDHASHDSGASRSLCQMGHRPLRSRAEAAFQHRAPSAVPAQRPTRLLGVRPGTRLGLGIKMLLSEAEPCLPHSRRQLTMPTETARLHLIMPTKTARPPGSEGLATQGVDSVPHWQAACPGLPRPRSTHVGAMLSSLWERPSKAMPTQAMPTSAGSRLQQGTESVGLPLAMIRSSIRQLVDRDTERDVSVPNEEGVTGIKEGVAGSIADSVERGSTSASATSGVESAGSLAPVEGVGLLDLASPEVPRPPAPVTLRQSGPEGLVCLPCPKLASGGLTSVPRPQPPTGKPPAVGQAAEPATATPTLGLPPPQRRVGAVQMPDTRCERTVTLAVEPRPPLQSMGSLAGGSDTQPRPSRGASGGSVAEQLVWLVQGNLPPQKGGGAPSPDHTPLPAGGGGAAQEEVGVAGLPLTGLEALLQAALEDEATRNHGDQEIASVASPSSIPATSMAAEQLLPDRHAMANSGASLSNGSVPHPVLASTASLLAVPHPQPLRSSPESPTLPRPQPLRSPESPTLPRPQPLHSPESPTLPRPQLLHSSPESPTVPRPQLLHSSPEPPTLPRPQLLHSSPEPPTLPRPQQLHFTSSSSEPSHPSPSPSASATSSTLSPTSPSGQPKRLTVSVPLSSVCFTRHSLLECWHPGAFGPGDVVWAKAPLLPAWPGTVIRHSDWRQDKLKPAPDGMLWIRWFNDSTVSLVDAEVVKPLNEGVRLRLKSCGGRGKRLPRPLELAIAKARKAHKKRLKVKLAQVV